MSPIDANEKESRFLASLFTVTSPRADSAAAGSALRGRPSFGEPIVAASLFMGRVVTMFAFNSV